MTLKTLFKDHNAAPKTNELYGKSLAVCATILQTSRFYPLDLNKISFFFKYKKI